MIRWYVKAYIFFMSCCSLLWAQNDSLLRKKYSFSYPKYTVFAFYDAIRFAGIGAEYRPLGSFSIDVKIGAVYPNPTLINLGSGYAIPLLNNNSYNGGNKYYPDKAYFYNRGGGIMLSPKWYLTNKRRFYLGLYGALYKYGYTNKYFLSEESITYVPSSNGGYVGVNTNIIYRGSNSTSSYAFGQTMGYLINLKRINFELFMAIGVEKTRNTITNEQTQIPYSIQQPLPTIRLDYETTPIFNALVGIKIGLGFKHKQLTSVKYYTSRLKGLLKEEDLFIEQLTPSDSLSEEDIKGYYVFKQKVFKNLKNEYQPGTTSDAQMNQLTEHAYQEIKKYIDYSFKK